MTDGTIYSGPHWQRFAANDSDEAHDYLRRAYVDNTIRSSRDRGKGVRLRTIATALGDVSMARL